MQNYVVVTVPQDLLPQVVGELLQFTTDPNRVDVVHSEVGRVIHVDPLVADAWLAYRKEREEADLAARGVVAEPAPEPEPTPAPEPESEPAPAPTPPPAPAPTPAPKPATVAESVTPPPTKPKLPPTKGAAS